MPKKSSKGEGVSWTKGRVFCYGYCPPSQKGGLPSMGKLFSDFVDFFTNPILIRANLAQKEDRQPDCRFAFLGRDLRGPNFLKPDSLPDIPGADKYTQSLSLLLRIGSSPFLNGCVIFIARVTPAH
jgi:hypothetical protein